jgi:hypothetical protein
MVLDELFAIFRAEARLVAIERQGGTCCCSGGDLARPQCRVDTDTLERCFCPDEVTGRHLELCNEVMVERAFDSYYEERGWLSMT